jgi:glycosyltransferase involved in cell wall biosynthesis
VACTLRAFQVVQRQRPDAVLTLAGSGSDEQALRRLSREHVRFIGRVDPDAMASLYADHDIYIQSPDVDNVPNSVIEAFASGLPVVSTDAGHVPTILKHGEHGLLAPVNAHEKLARHVLRLLDDPDLARRLTRLAFATCQARLSRRRPLSRPNDVSQRACSANRDLPRAEYDARRGRGIGASQTRSVTLPR